MTIKRRRESDGALWCEQCATYHAPGEQRLCWRVLREDADPPLVAGGQGRHGRDQIAAARAIVWCAIVALVVWCAIYVWRSIP